MHKLCVYIEENSLLDPDQYSFRAGHSTVDHLLSTYDDISFTTGKDHRYFFAKAFDTACHTVLPSKERCLGSKDLLIDWIQYFFVTEVCK